MSTFEELVRFTTFYQKNQLFNIGNTTVRHNLEVVTFVLLSAKILHYGVIHEVQMDFTKGNRTFRQNIMKHAIVLYYIILTLFNRLSVS